MLAGGLLSLSAIVTSMLMDKKVLTCEVSPLVRTLMEQPAIWGVPLSLGVMVVVSLLTPSADPGRRRPQDAPPPRAGGDGALEELHRALRGASGVSPRCQGRMRDRIRHRLLTPET